MTADSNMSPSPDAVARAEAALIRARDAAARRSQGAPNVVSMAKPTVAYVPVTPELAARWLEGNVVNRNLRTSKVQQYARDMREGRWTLSDSAICRTPDGRLLNGQHRLTAIVHSGATVVMLVASNMPEDSMPNMDQGVARTAADALKFHGEAHQALLAAAAKLSLIVDDGRVYQDTKVQSVSQGEIRDFIVEHPEIRTSVRVTSAVRRTIDCPPSALACAHWLIAAAAGTGFADLYLHQLASRSNEPDGSAILAVDSRLREVKRARASYPNRNFVYLLIKGWNHYAREATVRSLPIVPRGEFRIPQAVRWQRG